MKILVLEIKTASIDEFIRFWANLYFDKYEEKYTNNIGNQLIAESVRELYFWKNNGKISKTKTTTVKKHFIKNIESIIKLDKDTPIMELLNKFNKGGVIWRIFFLHIWNPKKYPIYDQHVYRAMIFLREGKIKEIPEREKDKISSYINEYLPFYAQFKEDKNRNVDKALWTFGKFLKSPYAKNNEYRLLNGFMKIDEIKI